MLAPQTYISDDQRRRGMRNLMIDAAAATAIGAINSGVVLLALALHIGASNVQIGLLAATPLLTQILQAPTVRLVERLRNRRLISVASVFLARIALPIYASVPFISDANLASIVLIGAALLHYGMNAVGACSWNSWIRDFIPADRLGSFFARRGLYGTMVSIVATLVGAYALDLAGHSRVLGDRIFSGLYLAGFGLGLLSTAALARVPEPLMQTPGYLVPLHSLLWAPLKDRDFRNLLRFLASWQFAVNLATPFFTVYFVRELGFSMGFVLILSVVSQVANVAIVRTWGGLSDRFANKSVLAVAAPINIFCIAAIAFTSEFDADWSRAAYLLGLHMIMGAAGAGVALASGNVVMKLSPEGKGTSYMATNALVGAIASGTAPILGGYATEFFARRRLELNLRWINPSGAHELLGLAFSHWEFFFLLSALLGLYALHRLSTVSEAGSVPGREVVEHIWLSTRRTLRNASTVAGLRLAVAFPGGELIKSRERKRFVLETIFENSAAPDAWFGARTVGGLLGAAFRKPEQGREFETLLRQLDAVAGGEAD
jgi:MFS family permease